MSEIKEARTLGEIIREARERAGLSMRDLSARIPIHYTYLADIERNRRLPSEQVLLELSKQSELKLSFDDLMAFAGRLGADAEEYLKTHPKIGMILRRIAREKLSDDDLIYIEATITHTIEQIKNKSE